MVSLPFFFFLNMKTPLFKIFFFLIFIFHTTPQVQSDETGEKLAFRILRDTASTFNQTGNGDGEGTLSLFNNDILQSYSPRDFIFNTCELQKYKAPQELMEIFPYYLSGYDDAGRPIWVGEFGKYNLRRISGGSKELQQSFDGYSNEITYNMIKSLFSSPKPGQPTFEFVFIVDFEGLNPDQITVGNLQLLIKLARRYAKMIDEYSKEVIVINVNFLAEQLTNLFRPVFGRLFEKIQIFGTNKQKWLPYLKRNYPKESLPEWYGGAKNFQPVGIYGRR